MSQTARTTQRRRKPVSARTALRVEITRLSEALVSLYDAHDNDIDAEQDACNHERPHIEAILASPLASLIFTRALERGEVRPVKIPDWIDSAALRAWNKAVKTGRYTDEAFSVIRPGILAGIVNACDNAARRATCYGLPLEPVLCQAFEALSRPKKMACSFDGYIQARTAIGASLGSFEAIRPPTCETVYGEAQIFLEIGKWDDPTLNIARFGGIWDRVCRISTMRDGIAPAQNTLDEWIGLQNPYIYTNYEHIPHLMGQVFNAENAMIAWSERLKTGNIPAGTHAAKIPIKHLELAGATPLEAWIIDTKDMWGRHVLLLTDPGDGSGVGVISRGVPFVRPDRRGEGIGTLLHMIAATYDLSLLHASSFSEEGYRARRSAHRRMCQKALDNGELVLAENILCYGLHTGQATPPREVEMSTDNSL